MTKFRKLREQLKPLEVGGVTETGKELGRGAYGVVLELKVHGLRCAGKRLHEMFFSATTGQEKTSITARFAEECLRHSKIRHPNIVQLLGIHFAPKSPVPTLIMELMPHSLAETLESYPNIPNHVKWRILLDVSIGLLFLHNLAPPVIHRDLTANNILLTENMRAKIADLGVARIVDINPAKLTAAPGTPSYMPPEAFIAQPAYDAKLDIFSFGNLIIHIAIHVWPIPLVEMHRADPDEPGKFTLVSEIERRAGYLSKMGEPHPLKSLATRCLQNDPRLRPTTAEAVQEMEHVVSSDPPPFTNTLDLLRELSSKTKEASGLWGKIDELKSQAGDSSEAQSPEATVPTDQIRELTSQLETATASLTSQEEELKLLQRDFAIKEKLIEDHEEELSARQQEVHCANEQVESCRKQLSAEEERVQSLLQQLSSKDEVAKALSDQLSAKDREISALQEAAQGVKSECKALKQRQDVLQQQVSPLKESLQKKVEENAVQRERIQASQKKVEEQAEEIAAKDILLQTQDKSICDLRVKLQTRGQGGPQADRQKAAVEVSLLHPGAVLQWDRCSNLPSGVWLAQAVQHKSKVYVQGDADTDEWQIFCFDHLADAWLSIEAPTKSSALTVYCSQLTLVGGKDAITGEATNQLWAMESDSWNQTLSPMTHARYGASAITSANHLVVAGGSDDRNRYCESVEVYNGETWMKTSPLPLARSYMKSTYHSGNWYLIGGISQYVTVFCAALTSLIDNASQSPDSSSQESAWKTLPPVPYLYSTGARFGGALLAVGGKERSGAPCSSVHMYSPLTQTWEKIFSMPEALDSTCTITLNTGEMLVIGGRSEAAAKSQHVYKASLNIQ